MMNGSKRLSYTIPKTNVRYSGKLKGIPQSSASRYKSDGKVVEPDLLNIPIIKQYDNAKLLPKYTSVLAKSGEDIVSMDDLDFLQQDLEKLLSTSAVRIRYLLSEIGEIDRNDESCNRKTHIKTSLKRKRIDEKPKFQDFKVTLPKNNSDKFWASIEPYCAGVTKDDVAFLDSIIREFSKQIDVDIPEVGDHYANVWSEDTINHEQNLGKSHKKTATTNEIKKNGLHTLVETFSIPETQRLLAGLLEEKALNNHPKNGDHFMKKSKIKSSDLGKSKSSITAQKTGTCFDRKLKTELMEQGIITMKDLTKNVSEDEILNEIKKCQQELTTVNEYNIEELNKLKKVVVQDLCSSDHKEELEKVDKDVLDLYNKIVVLRKTAQQEEGDEFDKYAFCKEISKEFESQTDYLLKQQIHLNLEISGLTDLQMIY